MKLAVEGGVLGPASESGSELSEKTGEGVRGPGRGEIARVTGASAKWTRLFALDILDGEEDGRMCLRARFRTLSSDDVAEVDFLSAERRGARAVG